MTILEDDDMGVAGEFSVERSRRLLDESEKYLVRACQGHKRCRDMMKLGFPTFATRAEGAHFWDPDGNRYLDFLMGFGPIVLGYNDPAVNAAVRAQMESGTIYSVANPLEIETSRRLISLIPNVERVCFFIGGSAATGGAVRMARAHTKRDHVLRCGYHGWHGWAQPQSAGVPESEASLSHEVPWFDLEGAEAVFQQYDGQVACWILETQQWHGATREYLQGAVDLAHAYGALMIFDETKVGFRMAFGGAGEHFGVTADMATFGKACCNGYPGSFVAGKAACMDVPELSIAGTFHCDMLSQVALNAVIDEMERRDGVAYQWKLGECFMEGMNAVSEANGFAWRLIGAGPMPSPFFPDEDERPVIYEKALPYCLAHGVYMHTCHPMFLTLSHTFEDIERVINIWDDALKATRA